MNIIQRLTFDAQQAFCGCGVELTAKTIGENDFSEISIGVCEQCYKESLDV